MTVNVAQIPGLAPPFSGHQATETLSPGGLPQIQLPTGHLATHLTSYANVKAVLSDPSFLRACTNTDEGPSYLPTTMPPEMLLNLDVPDHARLKGLANRFYSAASFMQSQDTVRQTLSELFRPGSNTDLMSEVLVPLTVTVNCSVLGLDPDEIPAFHQHAVEMQMAASDDVDSLKAHFAELYAYIEGLVTSRRVRGDGLIACLLDAGGNLDDALTPAEASAILLGSIVGGDQNVLSTLSKVMFVLLAESELWATLTDDPERIPAAVEELIRVLPLGTISTFPRVAGEDIRLPSGSSITRGEVVVADVHEANMDARVFPDPQVIDFNRSGPRHLQFGYGMHHCMGSALARMEITQTVDYLARNVPDLRLACPAEAIQWETGVLIHRPTTLPVAQGQELVA
ncbi:cytochrome P450 [Dermacoccus sp. PAMC28757]|uniref:cytochrome P450 n=1 Tax=Dermacoccus sp. PAMC28757 TaxID=2762331 RepID=UPI00164DC912|nr:cytochrome P450 [Dermacoccus sp. PAMC28757]QNK53290.1 cytochrome P450 [Dermacoccus sp. PAMC28757]